jgi:hypothetical protein
LTGTIFAAGVLVPLEIGRRIGEVGETASKGLGAFASRETGDALTKSGARSVLRVFGKGSKIRYVPAHPLARWICFSERVSCSGSTITSKPPATPATPIVRFRAAQKPGRAGEH